MGNWRRVVVIAAVCILAASIRCFAAPQDMPSTEAGSTQYFGRKVGQVELRGVSAFDRQRALQLIKLHQGDTLTRDALRDSIQTLYDTGYYSDIRAEADAMPLDEVSLTFVTTPNYFVSTIWIEGARKAPPTHLQLVNATKLELGELVTEQKLTDAVEGVRRLLATNGYQAATVQLRRLPHPQTQEMELTIVISPGKIARVGTVAVTGDPGYDLPEIEKISNLRPGKITGIDRTRRALERLRQSYRKQDRLAAQIQVTRRNFQPASNAEDYVLNIDRGPRVEIEVQGASLNGGQIRKYVPVYEEAAVDPDLLNEGARNISDYFQTQGYFDARTTYKQQDQSGDDLLRVVYTVNKGIKHKLVAIAIDGNQFFDRDTLREHMSIQPSSLLLPHGRFSQSLLNRDLQAIGDLYRGNGFQQTNVQSEVLDDYLGAKGHMKLLVHVHEGQQTLISSLTIAGNQAIPTEKLRTMIGSTEGQPFSDETMAVDRQSVLGFYLDRGFPNVQFEAAVTPVSQQPPRVALTYTISEGEQVSVGQVMVSGLHFTRPNVVQRELQIRPGDALSQSQMFDSQRRLYDTGLFTEVDTAVQNPDGDAPEKNVLFQMEEAKRYTFTYGVGVELQTGNTPGNQLQPQGRTGLSPRVSFDASRINFLGRDHTLSFKGRYGRLEQEALGSYEAPNWMGKENLRLILTTFYDVTRDVRTFTAERLEGSAQIEQRVNRSTTLLYGFLYRRVKVDPRTLEIDPNQIPLLSRPVRVGMPTFTFIRDQRDDPLDTRKGSYNTFDAGVSTGYFGSEASFSRFLYSNSTYHEFRKSHWVLARNTRVGVENTLGSSTFVPLPERFFAGGANSLRGFSLDQAGPRDMVTGFPVGGQALLVNQIELRFPPPTLPFFGNNLSPVLFEDAGNVFSSPDEMFPSIFRAHAGGCKLSNSNTTCDFNYFNHSVGFGIRYRTPIGPVRLDLGYSLNPTRFPVLDDPTRPLQTSRRINVYFSVGQSF